MSLSSFTHNQKTYHYAALSDLDHLGDWRSLPYSLKILLENVWRHVDGKTTNQDDLKAIINAPRHVIPHEIGFRPARVLMQDFTGVPAVVDLAAMRDAMEKMGGDPQHINPLIPVDLVIDHSVMVDAFGTPHAFDENVRIEYQRNKERYTFLKWGQKAFKNFRVVPPGMGICHQVNLEYLARVIWEKDSILYPDTVVGTDSHTTMVNGLSVLGWGVGGIEAEAAMLGQSISMLIPEVIGVHLTGKLPEGCTATDLVLTITHILRKKGVVGKFVEFYGPGLDYLTLADRATLANMAPEYGATCGFFPIDNETLTYLRLSGRDEEHVLLVEAYAKKQGLWRNDASNPVFHDSVELNLASIEPSLAGPKRPQDKVALRQLKETALSLGERGEGFAVEGKEYTLHHHDVVIAAITSCTNTSNPAILIAAGLLARKARAFGLDRKPWVKTSFAPGSQVVTDYLTHAGLMDDLNAIGFYLVGYGCTTCIGNSGPLDDAITQTIKDHDLKVAGVLSGNRNFEGRIHPHVRENYLASPPLVVAFALVGTTAVDLSTEPLGTSPDGPDIYLRDVWPTTDEIATVMNTCITPALFKERYAAVFAGDTFWQSLQVEATQTYGWNDDSTYVKNPPYFDEKIASASIGDIKGARFLAVLGDSITTDHISPAGSIKRDGPAGEYLESKHVNTDDFNSYGARRGNHEVMMRGTFANIRLQNEMVPGQTGGLTRFLGDNSGRVMSIFDAAMLYQTAKIPLVIVAGKEYGTGSSRDWAAKGTVLLGVRAVIAESFERIHRSNLVGMGVFPLQFKDGVNRHTLGLAGLEKITIQGLDQGIQPGMTVSLIIEDNTGQSRAVPIVCRIDTQDEVDYMNKGGILQYVLTQLKHAS
jgi:aconitate hydratase